MLLQALILASNDNSREVAVSPSWDPAIQQTLQQHGGRNRAPAQSLPPAVEPAPDTAPRGTSLQVVPPADEPPVPPAKGAG